MAKLLKRVLVTGGAGYVGSSLVPKLLSAGYEVTVLDLYLYGDNLFADLRGNPGLREVKGDLRKPADVERAMAGCDAVIHLACISNDPSFDLDPDLGKSINYDCFRPLVQAAKRAGVRRFICVLFLRLRRQERAGSHGEPRAAAVDGLLKFRPCARTCSWRSAGRLVTVILRPATVCGYAPRLRLDLTVNILTSLGVNNGRIKPCSAASSCARTSMSRT
jgi:NAD(P)-dependent dehydrogenase (short-subunit alcohol dehydrogenase family)